jgi:hypothetical protein
VRVEVLLSRGGEFSVHPHRILVDFPRSHAFKLTQLPNGTAGLIADVDFPRPNQYRTRFVQGIHGMCLKFDVAFLELTTSGDDNPMLIDHLENRSEISFCRMNR